MKILLFYHSLVSDWGHGVSHFLRGIASDLLARGHDVTIHEPKSAWSLCNLIREQGLGPVENFKSAYPELAPRARSYFSEKLDLDGTLEGADLVIVHETTPSDLVRKIGHHRRRHLYKLLYHDTHHRILTDFEAAKRIDLSNYDGVLCFGQVIADSYRFYGLAKEAWTWHEAADTRIFRPVTNGENKRESGDLVWVGNWAEGERRHELREFLIEPVRNLGVTASSRGARFPEDAKRELEDAGIHHRGWIANFHVPELLSRFRATVHIPRRPYAEALPGIPTIRVFEALACGIPLVCAPWQDVEGLFSPGEDFLLARDGKEMEELLHAVLTDADLARKLSAHGLATIRKRHTCAHRVDELLAISRPNPD